MNGLDIFNGQRWDILREVSEGIESPSTLARKFGTSLSNISQHLKLLEATGFVKATTKRTNKPGKPQKEYHINKTHAFFGYLNTHQAVRKEWTPTPPEGAFLSVLLLTDSKTRHHLLKFFLNKETVLEKAQAIAIIPKKSANIDLLVLTDDVEHIRAHHSSTPVKYDGVETNVVVWSHSAEELEGGLRRKEEYFLAYLKPLQIIYDPQNKLSTLLEAPYE